MFCTLLFDKKQRGDNGFVSVKVIWENNISVQIM